MEVSTKWSYPSWMVSFMENAMKIWMVTGGRPIIRKAPHGGEKNCHFLVKSETAKISKRPVKTDTNQAEMDIGSCFSPWKIAIF